MRHVGFAILALSDNCACLGRLHFRRADTCTHLNVVSLGYRVRRKLCDGCIVDADDA